MTGEIFISWCIIVGLLLILITLGNSLIARLPLSSAMLYLLVGFGMGPQGLGLIQLDPLRDASLIERLTEIAVLISLFGAGFKLELPLGRPGWRIPLQLATVSMLLTVAGITVVGIFLLGLPPGAALLLGAMLAPTDPVLASDVQVADPGDSDPLRFGLTGEGGLNDGTAFPLLMLGLGWLSLHDLGTGAWRWLTVDVIWAVLGGLAIGYVLGLLTGRAVLRLRARHHEAAGTDEFIAIGLIALAYGVALVCHTYGFLAVFAAGHALCQAKRGLNPDRSMSRTRPPSNDGAGSDSPVQMTNAVESFNSQLEHIAEVAIVLVVGALISSVNLKLDHMGFIVLLFFIIRPIAVHAGLLGITTTRRRRLLMSWFGIRGIGSLYYLAYAISHGLDHQLAQELFSITIAVIVASIVAHGISVTPLMHWYERRQHSRR